MERHFLTAAEPCSAPRYGRSSRQSPRRSIWRMFASRVPGHPSRLRHTSVVYAKVIELNRPKMYIFKTRHGSNMEYSWNAAAMYC